MNSKNIESLIPLTVVEFKLLIQNESIKVLDLRHQDEFVAQHIPETIFIGIEGPFDKWIQLVISKKETQLLLILPEDKEQDCFNRLKTLGYKNIIGFLEGGIQNWIAAKLPTTTLNSISADDFILKRESEKRTTIDVRKTSEFENSHLKDTSLIPLSIDNEFIKKFTVGKKYNLYCGGGYRSIIAISYLRIHNIKNITNIEGGYRSIQEGLSKINTNQNRPLNF
jgi:rhodanese-related sulfurtransferase